MAGRPRHTLHRHYIGLCCLAVRWSQWAAFNQNRGGGAWTEHKGLFSKRETASFLVVFKECLFSSIYAFLVQPPTSHLCPGSSTLDMYLINQADMVSVIFLTHIQSSSWASSLENLTLDTDAPKASKHAYMEDEDCNNAKGKITDMGQFYKLFWTTFSCALRPLKHCED